MTLQDANGLVAKLHRHHRPTQGGLFALGCELDERLVGVVIVGRPVARLLQDGTTAEVTRLATDGTPNACSFLYAAAWRAARALGYRRLLTYTLASEPGSSLKALKEAGWRLVSDTAGGGTWSRFSRERTDSHPLEVKKRWQVEA